MKRRLIGGAGVVVAGLGLVLVARPSLAADLAADPLLVSLVGLAAIASGIRAAGRLRGEESGHSRLPDPEYRGGIAVPGADFDDALEAGDGRVRDRLRQVAADVVARHEDCSTADAEEALRTGAWTDDADAASFFSAAVEPASARGDPAAQARHAVDRLCELAGLEADGGGTDEGGTDDEEVRPLPPAERVDPDDREYLPRPGEWVERHTRRWRGMTAATLLAGGVGVLTRSPSLVLVGAAGAALLAGIGVARAGDTQPLSLSVEREVEPSDPEPGEEVTVRVTVHNDGDRTLPDLRIVDGVPPGLVVTEGSPRRGAVLRPGGETTLTYRVAVEGGDHDFLPAVVVARDLLGTRERVARAGGDGTTVSARYRPEATDHPTLRDETTSHVGQVTTDTGGSGLEFHAIREYQPGDPISRVDWNRFARTGELATQEFRQERAATVVLAVDARREAYVAPDDRGRSAVARSVEAGSALASALLAAGNRVGATAISPEPLWVSPQGGRDGRIEIADALATDPALRPMPPERTAIPSLQTARLERRVPADAQLLLLSPLTDDAVVGLIRRLEAAGGAVSVVSPDPTARRTTGQRLAAVERAERIARLRRVGVPVHDWSAGETLAVSLARSRRVRR